MSKEFSCEYAMSAEVQKMCVVAKGFLPDVQKEEPPKGRAYVLPFF